MKCKKCQHEDCEWYEECIQTVGVENSIKGFRKTAKWIEFSTDPRNGDIIYKCSNCGAKTRCNFENYCFECGSYMKEGNDG